MLRAFEVGADGVIIGGCWPGECHYVTEGNYDALAMTHICRRLLARVGVDPRRMRLEWIAASEGSRFASVMSEFAEELAALGPLATGEDGDGAGLKRRLGALKRLAPYLKLVEREKLRPPEKSEDAYRTFFEREDVGRILDDEIGEKLAISEVLSLLQEGPMATKDICERLGIGSSVVSRYMKSASSRGLVRYDRESGSFALA